MKDSKQKFGSLRTKQIEDYRKEKVWDALFNARGIFKGTGKAQTDEEWYQWRKEYGEKLAAELAKKYNLKA